MLGSMTITETWDGPHVKQIDARLCKSAMIVGELEVVRCER